MMLAQFPWCLVFCCLLSTVTPEAGGDSQYPLVGGMSATMPMVCANLSSFRDKISPISLVSGVLLSFN